MYWASVPFWYVFEMFVTALFVGLPLAGYWALRFVLAVEKGGVAGRGGRCVAPWLIAGVTVVALVCNVPFLLRFSLSAPALGSYAERIIEQGPVD